MASVEPDRTCFAACWKCWKLLTDVKVKICADTKLEIGCTIYIDVPVGSNVWL
jgi:hypothetical protein